MISPIICQSSIIQGASSVFELIAAIGKLQKDDDKNENENKQDEESDQLIKVEDNNKIRKIKKSRRKKILK